MAILIVQFADRMAAGAFDKRVLIGRKPFNGVQLEHRAVSRIHAWIDKVDEGYRINNASKRNGTTVNGKQLIDGILLQDGDRIGIGPANLVFREGSQLPDGAVTFDISDKGTNPGFIDEGILFHCQCSAPLWVPASMAGAYGKCAHCKGDLTIPGVPLDGVSRPLSPMDSIADEPAIREPLGSTERTEDPLGADHEEQPRPAKKKTVSAFPKPQLEDHQICSVCQSEILPIDATTTCSACSQTYHTDCWLGNRGCAAYGCSQVGVLNIEPKAAPTVETPAAHHEEAPAKKAGFPWEFAFLGGSVIGSIVGALTFGLPPLIIGFFAMIHAMRRRGRVGITILSIFICLIGAAAGIWISQFWWYHVPLWPIKVPTKLPTKLPWRA